MKEELQIKKAADLADAKAPVSLNNDRARDFVAKTLDAKGVSERPSSYKTRPLFAWGGTALAIAACILLAFVMFRPSSGQPGTFQEQQSVHAGTATADSTSIANSDSIEIIVSEIVE